MGTEDAIRTLDLTDACAILLRRDSGIDPEEFCEMLAEDVRARFAGLHVIVVNELDDVGAVNEAAMNAAGWYRKTETNS